MLNSLIHFEYILLFLGLPLLKAGNLVFKSGDFEFKFDYFGFIRNGLKFILFVQLISAFYWSRLSFSLFTFCLSEVSVVESDLGEAG